MSTTERPLVEGPDVAPVTPAVGQDVVRRDAHLKVTGTAPYAYEHPTTDLADATAYLFPVLASVPTGTITDVDTGAADRVPGVRLVLTHLNAPRLRVRLIKGLHLLQSPVVQHRNQIVGAVVADTPEAARYAASLVRLGYEVAPAELSFDADGPAVQPVKRDYGMARGTESKGDVDAGLAGAAAVVQARYTTPDQYHVALEPHSVIAVWRPASKLDPRATRLSLFDGNQGPTPAMMVLPPMFGLLPRQVEIVSPFVGGAFGSKGLPNGVHVVAIMAAKLLPGTAVKAALTRQQTFHGTGYRPASVHDIRLGADAQGRLTSIEHVACTPLARSSSYVDQNTAATKIMYEVPHRRTEIRGHTLDIASGTTMRAPGEYTGMFALETAMDELAHTLGIDPVELRIRNEPELDPESGRPWSTRNLVTCLQEGARAFGWDPHGKGVAARQGEWAIGTGVAAATYPNRHVVAGRARIRYYRGRYTVALQASDIGTGAATILPQIAAQALGVPVEVVDADIGRSGLPLAMIAGGSMGTYTWGSSVVAAAEQFRRDHGDRPRDGSVSRARGSFPRGARRKAIFTFGAQFAEVAVSTVTGEVRVRRLHAHIDAGRVINPRTARSQVIGGMIMGLSGALHEESYRDPRFGHVVNGDLAGYHIAAHADIPDITLGWVEEPDEWNGPTGAKNVGEIGNVGVPAAIGNAIFAATGRRVRDLPFTPGRVLTGK